MTRPLRVFLCHSSNDKPTVRELYQKLRAEAWIEPWLDEEELYPGQDWNMEIEKAVEAADAIIVCLSKGSITKEGYVQRELRTVLDFADYKPEGTLYIIPVRLEECEPPRRLRAWQYADYFEGQRERAFQRLLVSLKRRADGLGLMAEEVERKQIEEQGKREAKKVTPELEIKKPEEQIVSAPVLEELKEKSKKEIPSKPFTKLLDPSSLSSNVTSSSQDRKQSVRKPLPNNNIRWLGIGGIILLVIVFGGLGLNYLVKNLPVATATVPSANDTPTFELATSTSVQFTSTPQLNKTPIPTPTLGFGSTMIGEKGETLVYVPAGEFTMGSENGADDEKPVHTVYLDAFWIDQTEVTNKQYQACVDAGTCETPSDPSSYSHPSYYGNPEFDNYPVVYVNWDKANRYCEVWAVGDLPTEAQWEKAARSTDERTYPWGENTPNKDLLNYNQNVGDTTKVGSYESGKSPYNAYDLVGNVWEWVNDYYQSDYYATLGDNASNPQGPSSGDTRVLRGGSWSLSAVRARSAVRLRLNPSGAGVSIGFRCARSLP